MTKSNHTISIKSFLIISFCLIMGFSGTRGYAQTGSGEQILEETGNLLESIAVYNYDSRSWLNDYLDLMRSVYNTPGAAAEVEKMMLDFLESDATYAGKQFICKHLRIIATDASVPVLAGMIRDPQTADMALYAMENIPGSAVDEALLKAMDETEEEVLAGVINALGVRKTGKTAKKAVRKLAGCTGNDNQEVAKAAVYALGRIGGEKAAAILEEEYLRAGPPFKWDIAGSWLKCADGFLEEGKGKKARNIYEKIYADSPPVTTRVAAFKGMLKTGDMPPENQILRILESGDPPMREAVVPMIRDLPEGSNMKIFLEPMDQWPDMLQMQVAVAIACRHDPLVHDKILRMAGHENPAIRLAAIQALREIGTAGDVLYLARLAAGGRGRGEEMARRCLYSLRGEKVEKAILEGMEKTSGEVRAELVRSIGTRNMISELDHVFKYASDPDRNVRKESMEVLGMLAGPGQLKQVIDLLTREESRQVRREAVQAVVSIVTQIPDESERAVEIIDALEVAGEIRNKEALIEILGEIASGQALYVLRDHLDHPEKDVQIAAVRALSGWPDAAPLWYLKSIVQKSEMPRKRALAFRGYARLIGMAEELSDQEKVKEYRLAFQLAENQREKIAVVSGLSGVVSLDALHWAVELLGDASLRREAEAAVARIAGETGDNHPEETRKIINKILEDTGPGEFRENLERILTYIK